MSGQVPVGPRHDEAWRARREAIWSLVMLPAFAAWTVAFIVLSAPVAEWLGYEVRSGDVVYLSDWLPWAIATVVWVLPLLVGVGLAVHALRRGAGSLAKIALGALVLSILFLTGPSLVDRIVNL